MISQTYRILTIWHFDPFYFARSFLTSGSAVQVFWVVLDKYWYKRILESFSLPGFLARRSTTMIRSCFRYVLIFLILLLWLSLFGFQESLHFFGTYYFNIISHIFVWIFECCAIINHKGWKSPFLNGSIVIFQSLVLYDYTIT